MKDENKITSSTVHPASSAHLTRREFFKRMGLLGGAIFVYASFGDPSSWAASQGDFNAFFRIGDDGRVTCFTGKIEMGQGVVTSLAKMLADELVVPLTSVDMVMGDTLLCPYDRGTFGSLSTPYFGVTLRQAAAEARTVPVQMAAQNRDRIGRQSCHAAAGVRRAGHHTHGRGDRQCGLRRYRHSLV